MYLEYVIFFKAAYKNTVHITCSKFYVPLFFLYIIHRAETINYKKKNFKLILSDTFIELNPNRVLFKRF